MNRELGRLIYRKNMFHRTIKDLEEDSEENRKKAQKKFFLFGWIGLLVGILTLISSILPLVLLGNVVQGIAFGILIFVLGVGIFTTSFHSLRAGFYLKFLAKK